MNQEQVDDLLVEWELARQLGHELDPEKLCVGNPDLVRFVTQGIHILRQTEWMMDDPAPTPFDPQILQSVSQTTLEAQFRQETASRTPSEASKTRADQTHADREQSLPQSDLPEIEGFQLQAELGRGGFGVVYRALDEKLERYVAIKIPLLNSATQREKYIREARHAARVEALGIVPVLQVGTTDKGLPFVVQKLITGKSLAEVLALGGKLSPSQTVALLVDVCKAVGTAHTQSLVHRDLKPANILIDETGKPWVTDFGLAVTEDDQAERRGEVAGTPSYMAPEQLEGKVDWIDGRTDVWALGVIMYQSLTGKMPFKAPTRGELKQQILKREPRPICQRLPLLPKMWDTILRRCCAKSIQERYDSAFDLAGDLLALKDRLDAESERWFNPILRDLQRSGDPLTLVDGTESSGKALTEFNSKGVANSKGFLVSHSWLGISALLIVTLTVVGIIFWRSLGSAIFPANPPQSSAAEQQAPENSATSKTPANPISNDPVNVPPQTLDSLQIVVSPSRPVDQDSSTRRFPTIQSAIDAAGEKQEIIIRPGDYRESISIRKSVILRGGKSLPGDNGSSENVQNENTVRVLFDESPAFTVSRGGTLTLLGIDVLPVNPNAEVNSIDVQGGAVEIRNCSFTAAGYDCVKLEPASSLLADTCSFFARHEPAIAAKRAEEFSLRKCSFQLVSGDEESFSEVQTLDEALPNLVGVQAIQMPGTLTECSFSGATATAIEWTETEGLVRIVDCSFHDLSAGLLALRCTRLSIDSALGKTLFSNCAKGIELNACNGSIANCELRFDWQSLERAGSVGIQIHDSAVSREESGGPTMQLNSCVIDGFESGLLISQAAVSASNLTIWNTKTYGISIFDNADLKLTGPAEVRNSLGVGILVESGSASLQRCQIRECSTAGIVVDGLEEALTMVGCTLQANGVGLILLSGSASLTNPQISGSETGILVARKSSLFPAPQNDAPMFLSVTGGRIAAGSKSIQFFSPGSYRIDDCVLEDQHGEPVIASGLTKVESDGMVKVNRSGP